VIGPPVRPAPVATLVTVPLPPEPESLARRKGYQSVARDGKPVSAGAVPFDPNSRFKEPEGDDVSFPVGSACQRKSCVTAAEVLLLNADA